MMKKETKLILYFVISLLFFSYSISSLLYSSEKFLMYMQNYILESRKNETLSELDLNLTDGWLALKDVTIDKSNILYSPFYRWYIQFNFWNSFNETFNEPFRLYYPKKKLELAIMKKTLNAKLLKNKIEDITLTAVYLVETGKQKKLLYFKRSNILVSGSKESLAEFIQLLKTK